MAYRTTRSVLSLALLLASTSIAQAGFIWLSNDNKPASNGDTSYSVQPPAAPADATAPAPQTQGRAWAVEPSVPVAGTPAPVAAPAEMAPPVSAQPMELSATPPAAPAPVMAPAVDVAAAPSVAPALGGETVSSQPIYSKGDQPATVAAAPVTAPVVQAPQPEVQLASSKDTPKLTDAPSAPAVASNMPNAQSIIDSMPSMTAPREAAATTPVSPQVVSAPAVLAAPAPAVTAPVLAPETTLATTVKAPEAPAAAPTSVAVSPITGESVAVTAPVVAPSSPDKVVEGFGKHVPLVIAMRQILPSDYTFAHSEGVDMSQSVDWQGGRPWQQVLNEAIKPAGLTAQVAGDTVMLSKAPVEMAPELTPPAANIVAPAVTAAPAPGAKAVLTNATIMQSPPSN